MGTSGWWTQQLAEFVAAVSAADSEAAGNGGAPCRLHRTPGDRNRERQRAGRVDGFPRAARRQRRRDAAQDRARPPDGTLRLAVDDDGDARGDPSEGSGSWASSIGLSGWAAR